MQKSSIPSDRSVLVTSISKKVPLLQAVRQAAQRVDPSIKLHGCDTKEDCIGRYAVDVFWHCKPLDQLTIEEILSYCKEHHISTIIPTRDADLTFYAEHLSTFDHHGISVMVSDLKTINHCQNKLLFYEVLSQLQFPVILTVQEIGLIDQQSYVVKERDGSGSHQIGLNLSKKDAISHAKMLAHPVFQPYINGLEWSVDVYRSHQGAVMGCVARQRNLIIDGESQITTTFSYPKLEKLVREMADALNIHGHAVFQLIEDIKGQFHVIECNPRFGGASTASIAVGLHSFDWFFLESKGVSLQEYPFIRSQTEIRQVRYPADWIFKW